MLKRAVSGSGGKAALGQRPRSTSCIEAGCSEAVDIIASFESEAKARSYKSNDEDNFNAIETIECFDAERWMLLQTSKEVVQPSSLKRNHPSK